MTRGFVHAPAALVALMAACTPTSTPPSPTPPARQARPAARTAVPEHETPRIDVTVKQVIDGDTLLVSGLPTGTERVRLIGVNAPETGKGYTTRECFGAESARWLSEQAPRGSRLGLVLDVGPRDRFGRVLAYAYRADGTFLNGALVANGYAHAVTIPPNLRHAQELLALQRTALRENRGLWAACRG